MTTSLHGPAGSHIDVQNSAAAADGYAGWTVASAFRWSMTTTGSSRASGLAWGHGTPFRVLGPFAPGVAALRAEPDVIVVDLERDEGAG